MKSVITKIAIFAIGVGVGILAVKKYYKNIAEEEIESVKEHLGTHKKFEPSDSTSNANAVQSKEGLMKSEHEKQRSVTNPLTRSSLDNDPYTQVKKNYNLMGSQPVEDEEKEPEDEFGPTDAAGKTEEEMNPEVNRDQPYLISDEEFAETFDNHEKISLYYYRIDDVLCEENEEILMDRETIVGDEAIKELDMEPTVWVRNERLDIDYEIMALNKSYQETVHGIGLEDNLSPRERYMKKIGKGKEHLDE